MISIVDGIIIGIVQGIAEWLPISSEGMIVLVGINFLDFDPTVIVDLALLLHMGTVVSVVVYFWQDLQDLVLNWRKNYRLWQFILIATVISLGIAGPLYLLLDNLAQLEQAGSILTLVMGIALLITAFLLSLKQTGKRLMAAARLPDALILGMVQGLAIIPGISRSGSTVAVALWRGFSATDALRVSFILGIPMMIIGSLVLLIGGDGAGVLFSSGGMAALVTTAIVGFITITIFMSLARKINFSKFVAFIGFLSLLAGVLQLL